MTNTENIWDNEAMATVLNNPTVLVCFQKTKEKIFYGLINKRFHANTKNIWDNVAMATALNNPTVLVYFQKSKEISEANASSEVIVTAQKNRE